MFSPSLLQPKRYDPQPKNKNVQEQLKNYNIADNYINIDNIGALLLFISLA